MLNNHLKHWLYRIVLICGFLFLGLISNCRDYPGRPESPPLNDFLCKEFKNLAAFVTNPDGSGGRMVSTLETTSFRINTDRSFTLQVDVYYEILDTTYSFYQHGSYRLADAYFVESEEWLAADVWEGWIRFEPVEDLSWESTFSVSGYGFLTFDEGPLFSLGDGNGYLKIYYWGSAN